MEPRTSQLDISSLQKIRKSRSGVALVLVLGFLVLITIVSVGFLVSVSTEYSTASSANAGSTGTQLADASVQLVMGQIRQATSLGPNIAWASQPGMIRTYGSGNAASSNPLAYYKLYSSDEMVVNSSAIEAFDLSNDVPANWNSLPALFTDLNAPVTSSTGVLNYPIIDPRAADVVSGHPLVEGFSISNAPTIGTDNPAPMPTKWIYVLKDGTLTAPAGGTSTADFSSAPAGKIPTTENPIVGRIAFWTDDETCKLNLNTAVGGTHWEDPMFTSNMDLAFSRYKPMANEFNRFPGHPATTSLLPVFWSFTGLSSPFQNLFPSMAHSQYTMAQDVAPTLTPLERDAFQDLLQFSPRNVWGGSEMSTAPTAGYGLTGTAAPTPISPDSDRLYASVDEAIFGYPGTIPNGREDQGNALALDNDNLKKLRFFLTTSSRSPETNPFNQPKVGIWPVPELISKRSALDRLIAFCSTLRSDATQLPTETSNFTYFFTRNNAQSATDDFQPDSRNDKIFDYLSDSFARPVPGFGASIESRYTAEGGRRILALIYDYIRSTINLLDSNFGSTGSGNNLRYLNTFLNTANDPARYGFGQVVPIQITKGSTMYKGAGRFPLLKQAGFLFMVRAANQPPLLCQPDGRPKVFRADGVEIAYTDPLVLAGNAFARLNPDHPWVAGKLTDTQLAASTPETLVPQLRSRTAIDGVFPPVMAGPDSPSSVSQLFPIFGRWVQNVAPPVAGTPSGEWVASITKSAAADNANGLNTITFPTNIDLTRSGLSNAFAYIQYPTIHGTNSASGFYGVTEIVNDPQTIGGFTYVKAAVPVPASHNPPQTHAGMPYLTMQSPVDGAFTVNNPRYQEGELPARNLLPPGSTEMQAVFIVDPVNIASGMTPIQPKFQVRVSGLNTFSANGVNLGFGPAVEQSNLKTSNTPTPYYNLGMQTISVGPGFYKGSGLSSRSSAGANQEKLTFVGTPVIVHSSSFSFQGGIAEIQFFAPQLDVPSVQSSNLTNPIPIAEGPNASTLIQTYNIQFPNETFPTPAMPQTPSDRAGAQFSNKLFTGATVDYNANNDPGPYNNSTGRITPTLPRGIPSRVADLVPSTLLTPDPGSPLSLNPMAGVGQAMWSPPVPSSTVPNPPATNTYAPGKTRFFYGAGNDTAMTAYFLPQRNGYPDSEPRVKLTCDTIRMVECLYGDTRVFAGLPVVGTEFFRPHRFYRDLEMRAAHTLRGAIFGQYPDASRNSSSNFRGATDHSLNDASVIDPSWNYNIWAGMPNSEGASLIGRQQGDKIARMAGSTAQASQNGGIRSQSPYTTSSSEFDDSIFNATWNGVTEFSEVWARGGDFSNGIGSEPDGPYINKPSEAGGMWSTTTTILNYYPEWWDYGSTTSGFALATQFSPNRMISSPVAFGSLPVGGTPTDAWRTLLFCANPNASNPTSYLTRMADTDVTLANEVPTGAKAPDHLILDFFMMPVVEPYAISEPFSTAGKVNMNYQIAPFTYIERNTALRGVFHGTLLTAVDDRFVPSKTGHEESFYKSNIQNTGLSAITFARATDAYGQFLAQSANWGFRYPIHAGETLKQFNSRFAKGDLFRSPSEICSLFLYPARQPVNASDPATALVNWDALNSNIKSWWYDNAGTTRKGLTGDNLRERPYSSLYPRLTTKSNSYTVHFRVQVLKKIPGTEVDEWVEEKDLVLSEYRGSSLIERNIDPGDPNLPDFALDPDATLDDFYRFRIVSTKKFSAE